MSDGRLLLLTEDGKIVVAGAYDSRIVKKLLTDNVAWEQIS